MKKLIISFMVLLLTIPAIAQEKEAEDRNNLISFSLTRLFTGNMTLSYERMFNNSGALLAAGITLKDNTSETLTGYNFELQYRVYTKLLREKTFQGFFLSPYVTYNTFQEENRYFDFSTNETIVDKKDYAYYGFGVQVGMKIAIAQRLVFTYELGGGLRNPIGDSKGGSGILDPGYKGIAPRANISFGYFF
jgi:hypothetical protein